MTVPMIEAELELEAKTELGEGPVWDPLGRCLYFVDILRGHVHRYEPATRTFGTFRIGQSVGAIALTESGGLVLAVRDGFARLNVESGDVSVIAKVEADRPHLRMNDGNCDAAGRFWAGTMALDERPDAGTLYRLSPGGQVEVMLRPVTISNGIDWTDDERSMYFIDTAAGSVDVFDFEATTGAISNRRTFVGIAREQGAPDGLTVDADGFVWVSLWGGGAVHRYAPSGALDHVVRLPVTHPTSCAFGGSDLRDLYITTASVALTPGERARQPQAGGLFRCRPGPSGRPPNRYKD